MWILNNNRSWPQRAISLWEIIIIISTKKELQTQAIVAIVFIGTKEVGQTIQTTVAPIVSSNANVQALDAQPDVFIVTRQPRISDRI